MVVLHAASIGLKSVLAEANGATVQLVRRGVRA